MKRLKASAARHLASLPRVGDLVAGRTVEKIEREENYFGNLITYIYLSGHLSRDIHLPPTDAKTRYVIGGQVIANHPSENPLSEEGGTALLVLFGLVVAGAAGYYFGKNAQSTKSPTVAGT